MRVFAQMKSVGKRNGALEPIAYEIPDDTGSLRQLLLAFAQAEVADFNNKGTEVQLVDFLTAHEIDDQAEAGKVGFGRLWSDAKADADKAAAVALQAWEDGLVRVFLGDQELEGLDAPLAIPADAVFTFIRLSFLAGRMW